AGKGILEDDLHSTAQWTHRFAVATVDAFAIEPDLAALIADKPDECLPESGLARAAFAYNAQRLMSHQFYVEIVDGLQVEKVRPEESTALERIGHPDLLALEHSIMDVFRQWQRCALRLGGQQMAGIGVLWVGK